MFSCGSLIWSPSGPGGSRNCSTTASRRPLLRRIAPGLGVHDPPPPSGGCPRTSSDSLAYSGLAAGGAGNHGFDASCCPLSVLESVALGLLIHFSCLIR